MWKAIRNINDIQAEDDMRSLQKMKKHGWLKTEECAAKALSCRL